MNEGDRASALYPSSPPSLFSPPVSLRLPEQASGSVEAYIGGGGVFSFLFGEGKGIDISRNRPLHVDISLPLLGGRLSIG